MEKRAKSVAVSIKNNSYKVLIGNSILIKIKTMNKILFRDRFVIIVSAKIIELYSHLINNTFKKYNNYDIFVMKDGEENKNYLYAEEFLNKMLKNGYSRKSAIVAVGGGVVGDFAGFIAAVFMRGIPIIHVPTTLLAMVDSSIGGKVAVNISAGKNMVGAFHQPSIVISDIDFIKTLPDNELKNGLTEAVKHWIIGEKRLLNIFHKNDLNSIRKPKVLEKVVYLSALFKSRIVKLDEKEQGIRAILNFGHTIGHAIESLSGYRTVSHGEAVAIGLKIEMEVSRRLGWLTEIENILVNEIISKYGLIYSDYKFNADDIIKHMKYDKKNYDGKLKFVLLKGLGNPVYDQEVDKRILKDVINNFK